MEICVITTPPWIKMFCQNQYDYGDENAGRLQQKEWIRKGYISLISRIRQANKHHSRRSIENSRYFKSCSSSKSNTAVKKPMHHIQLHKHTPWLENILTHNRSQIKNDNSLNGPHFPVRQRWLQTERAG